MRNRGIFLAVLVFVLALTSNAFAAVYDWSDAPGYESAHNRGWGTVGGSCGTWQWLGATWNAETGARYDDGDTSDDGIWWSIDGRNGYYGHESVTLGETIWIKIGMHENPTNNNFTDYLRIWVDWNGNKDFEINTRELAYSFDWTESSGHQNIWTLYVPIEVPLDAAIGTTYLRARLCCGTNQQYRFPYGNTSQGETEDWALTIEGTQVPEPSSILLLLSGLTGIILKRFKKKELKCLN